MKNIKFNIVFIAYAAILSTGNANAQAKQTVEGAQTFLSQLAGGGRGVDVHLSFLEDGGLIFRDGKAVGWKWKNFKANGVGAGHGDSCVTRVESLIEDAPYPAKDDEFKVPPSVVFRPPHFFDWRKASVERGTAGGVFVSVPSKKFKILRLGFYSGEPEMLDRIEYAMKFLQASCDESANTGF